MIHTLALNYVLALGLAGSSTVNYNAKTPFVVPENKPASVPTIEDCQYNDTEKIDLNKIMEDVNISEKDCAKTVVAQYALDFLNKNTATVDYDHARTTKTAYKVNDLIAEALQNDSFRQAVIETDRNYDGTVDYKEAKNIADFLNY
ncbi:MAG: hypothetical protein Q8R37_00915 [Nanoarchaeota archaeon]|nr:hypothetical protein [Nanoarchaeota archaeon]